MGLDLSRIEAWTREMLEAEARRCRIRNPQFRTRGELIRLLLKHQYGDRFSAGRERIARGMRTIEQARELLGMAVGAALASVGRAKVVSRPPVPHPAARMPNHEMVPPARESLDSVAYLQTPIPPLHVPEHDSEADEQAYAPQPTQTLEIAPPPFPTAPIATTRTFVEEPIRTRTMARLLCVQGHRERALLIYEELLAQNSGDAALLAEAEAVRRGEMLDEPLLPDPPFEAERWPIPETGDQLSCAGSADDGLWLRWHVTSAGQRRALAVLGSDGELALRVVSIGPDPERVVRSEITEHGPVADHGEWCAPSLARGTRCFAAVGMRAGARFVAIAHVQSSEKPAPREAVRRAAEASADTRNQSRMPHDAA